MTEKLLTYALGRGLDDHDMPVVRAHPPRPAPRRLSVFVAGPRRSSNSVPFQMRMKLERASRHVMFITKMSLPRRTFLRGHGRAVGAAAARRDGAGAHRSAKTAAKPPLRFGAVFVPNGAIMDNGSRRRRGRTSSSRPILKPLETFRDSAGRRQQSHTSQPGVVEGDHAISAAGWLTGVYPKRTEAEDIRAGMTIDQIVARQIGQETPFPSLELATDGLHGLHRRVHQRVQLRVHQHDLVELADDAAADGDQPACGLRAHVRSRPAHRSSATRAGSAT